MVERKNKDLTPPVAVASDGAHAAVRSVLGAIPIGGSAAIETFVQFFSPPLEKRKQKWMEDVAEAIYELQDKGIDLEQLQNNEEFIDIVMYVSQVAIRTSQEEKLSAYKNAILNSAINDDFDASVRQIFINNIDTLTVWHIRLLGLFCNPVEWCAKNNIHHQGGVGQLVEKAFPELRGKLSFYKQIGKELTAKGLSELEIFNVTMTTSGALAPRNTNLGNQFLDFISAHETTD